MVDRSELVRAFFDKTDLYLDNSFGLALRALIVREFLGDLSRSTILDIGCGNAAMSLPYIGQGNRLTLIDLSSEMLALAYAHTPPDLRDHVSYLNRDFLTFTPITRFDVIICLGVLAHLPSVEHGIAKIASLLKPGGHCIVQFTDQKRLVAKIDRAYQMLRQTMRPLYDYSPNPMSSTSVEKMLDDHGLRIVARRRYSLLLPGMGKLPDRFLFRYQLLSLRNPVLSSLGSEVILHLTKPGGDAHDGVADQDGPLR